MATLANRQFHSTRIILYFGCTNIIFINCIIKDENNFYNAKEFDPENFDAANKPNKFAFQSFGQGPRNCIGMRLAIYLTLCLSI